MSDDHTNGPGGAGQGAGSGPRRPGDEHEQVGSVSEEAAKLLVALQGWAREHAGDASRAAGDFSRAAGGLGTSYISDGSAACRVCPLCQLIALVRGINPESLDQVRHAAGSMLNALTELLDAAQRSQERRSSPVEKIRLADDDPQEPRWR